VADVAGELVLVVRGEVGLAVVTTDVGLDVVVVILKVSELLSSVVDISDDLVRVV
jgi:hypothetical protein